VCVQAPRGKDTGPRWLHSKDPDGKYQGQGKPYTRGKILSRRTTITDVGNP